MSMGLAAMGLAAMVAGGNGFDGNGRDVNGLDGDSGGRQRRATTAAADDRGVVCQEVPRLGVDTHHAQVAVGNSLAIRVFQERFPYFKYCRAKSESSLLL